MPPVAGFVAGIAADFFADFVGGTIFDLAVAGVYYGTEAGLLYGASRVASALSPKPKFGSLRASSTQVMVQGTAESHRVIYGRMVTSGVFYPLAASGTKGEYLHFALILASHECDSVPQVYFNNEPLTLDGSGNVTAPAKYAGLARVKIHLGAYNQTVDTDTQTDLGSTFWPNSATFAGRCYLLIRLKYDQSAFPSGVPNVLAFVNGRKVYDPRDNTQTADVPSTWKHNDNAALCVADWVAGVPQYNEAGAVIRPFGFRAPFAEVSSADLIEAANICDESITLADTTTEERYNCNGIVTVSATRGDVLDALKGSMAGDVVYIGGKWIIRAGAYRTPTVTLTQDDLRAGLQNLQVKPSRKDLANGVKGTFVSPANNWQATDFPPVTNSTYLAEDGGDRLWLDIEGPFTTSAAAIQRIAKLKMEQTRQSISFVARCKLTALQNQVTDTVNFTYARFGWTAKPFRIESFALVIENDANGNPVLGCDLGLRETASGVYDWANGEETTVDLAPNTSLPSPFSPAAPTGLTLAVTSFRQPDGSLVPKLQVSWTAPADQFVLSGGIIRIQYKKHADSSWSEWAPVKGDQVFTFILALLIGTSYDVRIRSENGLGVASTWVEVDSFTFTGDTTAPATPSGLAFSVGTGKAVSLSWTRNTETDLDEYIIQRSPDNSTWAEISRAASNRFVDTLVTLGSSYYYRVAAVDQSGNVSTYSSSVGPATPVTPPPTVDTTPPSDPSAPTFSSNGTLQAGDGSISAFIVVNMPSMPTGGVALNLFARVHGTTDWVLYEQKDTGGGTARADGLVAGGSYDLGVQAVSAFGYCSNIVTLNSQGAPNTSSAPATPTGLTCDGKVVPKKIDATSYYFGLHVSWASNTEPDFDHYEVKITGTDSDGATDLTFTTQNGADTNDVQETSINLYSGTLPAAYVRVRAVNRSGLQSPWATLSGSQTGNANTGINFGTSSGTIVQGNDSRVVNAVPNTRQVNGHALTADVTLSASDVSAVPTSRTVNGHALSSNVTLTKGDITNLGDSDIPTFAGIDVTGNGIQYAASGNRIKLIWNGANVKVYVDGSAQGTIPNP